MSRTLFSHRSSAESNYREITVFTCSRISAPDGKILCDHRQDGNDEVHRL